MIHPNSKLPFGKKVSHEKGRYITVASRELIVNFAKYKLTHLVCKKIVFYNQTCQFVQSQCYIVQNVRHLKSQDIYKSLLVDIALIMYLSRLSFPPLASVADVFGGIHSSGLSNFQTWPSNSRLYICRF